MENNVQLIEEQALGTDQLLKLTALVYLKEALIAQEYEKCQELVGTARKLGIDTGDITAVIADYLNAGNPVRQKGNRIRTLKEVN